MPDVTAAFAAAVRLHHAGEFPAAEAAYRAILADAGSHAPSLCNLGVLRVRAGDVAEASKLYNLALATTPDYPDAHFNLGNLFRRSGDLAAAAGHFRACLRGHPQHASAAYNLGLVLAAGGDVVSAAQAFQAVVRLEPANADAHMRLGDAFVRAGRVADGVAAFRAALAAAPDDPRGYYNLGLALANAGETAAAAEHLQKAIRLKPDYAEAHNAIGLNLEAAGRKDDALFHYQKAVALKPDLADAWSNLGTSLADLGQTTEAVACLRKSLAHRPDAPAVHSNLLLLLNYSSGIAPAALTAEHTAWAAKFAPPCPTPHPVTPPADPARRLRVGYLSSDFRHHTLAGFITAVLTHHDRNEVEVFTYASVLRPDAVTDELKALADHWRPVGPLPDEAVYNRIREDRIDVLIDLNGHTAGNRMLVLANRPAPLCVTLFGYPATTGLAAVDYRVTDAVAEPPGTTEAYSVEKLLRLDGPAWVYAPPPLDVPVGPLPGLASRQFTFGCLNNPAKISDACLEAWAALMGTVMGTKLVLLAGPSQAGAKRLADRFVKAGVLRERVELVPRLTREAYFAKYGEFDVCLDPFPYNGGVTTGDALWMGVPVLTVAGDTYVSRQGAMANAAVGLDEFTLKSAAALPMAAKGWTQRRPELAAIRANLRERLMSSPLGDPAAYVRRLEAGLRRAWRDRLAADAG